ncbi:unnamed protein product [Protopolystoma xenopodis]|uniref:Uncharacterized protein n=1 Tax=Protopolystoma xenopodis TaxID=117903 RepID=A0A448WJ36_9PLAT|nr:unnamed protein product [Protopolystoma xenopodis]
MNVVLKPNGCSITGINYPLLPDSLCHSPSGEYSQFIPAGPGDVPSVCFRQLGPPAPGIGTDTQPPLLPPQLSVTNCCLSMEFHAREVPHFYFFGSHFMLLRSG